MHEINRRKQHENDIQIEGSETEKCDCLKYGHECKTVVDIGCGLGGLQHFIVDTVPPREGSHLLDWSRIFLDNYKRAERLGPFLGGRHVEVWKKR